MAPSQNNPIGVIDSGVGGISVLKCIRAHLPHENLIYVADSKFAPYGEKANEEITRRVLTAFDFLNKQEVKSVVVACNTATAASIQIVRDKFNYPIFKMGLITRNKSKIGVYEPFFDKINLGEIPNDYVENEQKNTNYDLRSKFTLTDDVDVEIIEVAPFTDEDIQTLLMLRISIPHYEPGEYETGNMKIIIKRKI